MLAPSPLSLTLGSNPEGQEQRLCSSFTSTSETQAGILGLIHHLPRTSTPPAPPPRQVRVLPALRSRLLPKMGTFRRKNQSQSQARKQGVDL